MPGWGLLAGRGAGAGGCEGARDAERRARLDADGSTAGEGGAAAARTATLARVGERALDVRCGGAAPPPRGGGAAAPRAGGGGGAPPPLPPRLPSRVGARYACWP